MSLWGGPAPTSFLQEPDPPPSFLSLPSASPWCRGGWGLEAVPPSREPGMAGAMRPPPLLGPWFLHLCTPPPPLQCHKNHIRWEKTCRRAWGASKVHQRGRRPGKASGPEPCPPVWTHGGRSHTLKCIPDRSEGAAAPMGSAPAAQLEPHVVGPSGTAAQHILDAQAGACSQGGQLLLGWGMQ